MSNEITKPLESIKKGLMTSGALALYADNLPNVAGKAAVAAAQAHANMMYTAVVNNPQIQGCTVRSLAKCGGESASVDLAVDIRGLAYLIPYKNKGVMEAQFQISYLGLIELAYRSGKVNAISAHCVYASEKDVVKIERVNGRFAVTHPFSYDAPSGKMIAVYAAAEIQGLGPQTMVLRTDQVEKLRSNSKAPNSPAWQNHYEAMAKKSAIRQLAKFLPKSILKDFSRGAAMDEQQTFGDAQAESEALIDTKTGSEPMDTQFEDPALRDEEVGDAQEQKPDDNSKPAFLDDTEGEKKAKAKAAAQKKKLAKAAAVAGQFVCKNRNCASKGVVFENPKMIKKGKTMVPQCEKCLGYNIEAVEA